MCFEAAHELLIAEGIEAAEDFAKDTDQRAYVVEVCWNRVETDACAPQ
jgi:hypothetical protein